MPIRLVLFALAVSLWGCGDDSDPPPTAVVVEPEPPADSMQVGGQTVLRPSGALKPWDLSPIVPVDSVRSMPAGTTVFLRTEFARGELADLEMTFVQVVNDFLPPMPVYMFEASDPVLIQLGGIAQGMSGSPIFTEQGTWGAIAYGFDSQDSPPYYFFATPIEWMVGTQGRVPAAKPMATWAGNRITPLEIPLLGAGLNRVHPRPNGQSSLLSKASSASLTQEHQEHFEAGRPLTVGLLLGELTLGSLGTISYVDGDRIYGFGHPMSSAGPVELPIIEARVLGEISNLTAPYKFATMNPTVRGTLTEDRLPAVRGVLNEEPALVPVKSVYVFPSGSTVELTHRMAVGLDSYYEYDLVSSAFFEPLFNRIDNDPGHSIRVTTDVSFTGSDSALTRSRLYSMPSGQLVDAVYRAYNGVSSALSELVTRDDYALHIREAEVHIEIIPETRFATVTKVAADTVISLGSTLDITASLRVGRHRDREVELALSVPDTLPPGLYQLEVGVAALLGDDPLFDFDVPSSSGSFGSEETLDDVFARLNKPDQNVVLKARLTFGGPSNEEDFTDPASYSEDDQSEPKGDFSEPSPPDDFLFDAPPASISAQQDIDLVLQGVQTLEVEVVEEE